MAQERKGDIAMTDADELILNLTNPDDKQAYAYTRKIAAESASSDAYYSKLPAFASLLENGKSYIRTRAFILCCSQARWDHDGKLSELLPRMFPLLHDEKPTVVRQCLNAVTEIAVFRPELGSSIASEVQTIDLSSYKDTMRPLIQKDISALLDLIGEEIS